MTNEVIIRCQ